MDENPDGTAISLKKLEANRRNAQLSTGPKTVRGKRWSRRNAFKHGVVAYDIIVDTEDTLDFAELLEDLQRDLEPIGMLEEMFVDKIAACWLRHTRALKCEAEMVKGKTMPEYLSPRSHNLPMNENLDRIIRYETANQRQLAYAINQLERLQRARKGENVPAPVSVQVSSDQ